MKKSTMRKSNIEEMTPGQLFCYRDKLKKRYKMNFRYGHIKDRALEVAINKEDEKVINRLNYLGKTHWEFCDDVECEECQELLIYFGRYGERRKGIFRTWYELNVLDVP